MRFRSEVRPSRWLSGLAVVTGLGMLSVGGLAFYGLYQGYAWASGSAGPSTPVGGYAQVMMALMAFVGFWLLLVLGGTVYHAVNAFTRRGLPAEIVEHEGSLPGSQSNAANRLRELEKLRSEGLLSALEYDQRRKAILEQL